MIVLLAEDDAIARDHLGRLIEAEGHGVQAAEDGKAAWDMFQRFEPDMVLADLHMPGMSGIELLSQIRRLGENCPVVIMTGHGSEESAQAAIRHGANDYLRKPIDTSELTRVLRRMATVVHSSRHEREVASYTIRHALTMQVPNMVQLVPTLSQFLINHAAPYVSTDEQSGLRLGLHELIANAIEHGNLGITWEEKASALEAGPEALRQLYFARMADPAMGKRRVTIDYRMERDALEWTITDEGKGFDFNKLRNPVEESRIEAVHGRGIYLARIQFDQIEYLGRGNCVRVRKNLVRSRTSSAMIDLKALTAPTPLPKL